MFEDLKEQLFDKDIKMVIIDNYYVFIEDLKITKLDDDYIVQMKNARKFDCTSTYNKTVICYQSNLTDKSLILKEINFITLKEIHDWIDRTEDEAYCIRNIKILEKEEDDPIYSDSSFVSKNYRISNQILEKQKEREGRYYLEYIKNQKLEDIQEFTKVAIENNVVLDQIQKQNKTIIGKFINWICK